MPDDDLLNPGAVAAVLEALRRDYSLVLVNAEAKDHRMSSTLIPTCIDISSDRVYGPGDVMSCS